MTVATLLCRQLLLSAVEEDGRPQESDTTLENRLKQCWRVDMNKRELKWRQYSCVVDKAWNARMKYLIYKGLFLVMNRQLLRKEQGLAVLSWSRVFHWQVWYGKFLPALFMVRWIAPGPLLYFMKWSKIRSSPALFYQAIRLNFIKELSLIKLLWCLATPWKIFVVIQKKK